MRGFYYWSLIDNFEWAAGFEPAFGLYEVDYNTSARTPRDSVAVFQSITRTNGIDHEQWSKHGRKVHAHGEHHHAIDLTPL